ncbi:MAG: peroxide stress protein YaaA [Rhodoferax sp.]|nr:peroxide stress protein YaaA [Actinomycetota bacterium]
MITLLSPAKSLDTASRLPTRKASQPRLLDRSVELIEVMRRKSPDEVAELMDISADLAELNVERYRDFAVPFTKRNARPAVLLFNGDVYQGMDVRNRFDERDFTEAQKTVRILSGLYGLLRPLDLIQPYRLEMGTRVATDRGASLYDYWGATITEQVNADLAASPGPDVVVNLASDEYFRSVRPDEVAGRVVAPRFLDADPAGRYRVVSFFAKRARGDLAAWLVLNRVRSVRAMHGFDGGGYRYDPKQSTPDAPAFVRGAPAA